MKPLRVVQWATGNVGTGSLRAVISHPALELVGVWVHSEAKEGVDAGTLAGLPEVGVRATRSVEEIVALGADCVLYMPFDIDADHLVRLLESGTNVVTTKGEFQNPTFVPRALRTRIEAACERGGTSVYSTGSSPGIITDALPIALSSFQRRLDHLIVDEYSDVSDRDSPDIIFQAMGFGRTPEEANAGGLALHLRQSRERSFHLLADAFGIPLEGLATEAEIGLARERTEIAAGVIEAGTVAGTRLTVSGLYDGRAVFTFRANWYATRNMDVDWDLLHSGWRIAVEGDTPMDVLITFPVPLEDYAAFTPGLTAHPAVNAVAQVCEARPGILRSVDLPHILPVFGVPSEHPREEVAFGHGHGH